MRDKTHVGFIDAHAEGDGGHHHNAFILLKARLMFGTRGGVHACVVWQGAHALCLEPRGSFIDFFA